MDKISYSMSDYASFFRVLSNLSRFNILRILFNKDGVPERLSVTMLANTGNIPMSKISDQLTVLRKHSFIEYNKEGTTVYYKINKDRIFYVINSYYSQLSLQHDNHSISQIVKDPFNPDSFNIYNVLANETRCEMIIKIAAGEKFVNELCDMFYLEQPTISMHLGIIQKCKLINCKKFKTKKYYYLL